MSKPTEEQLAAKALGEILTSTMLAAHGYGVTNTRTFLYIWEREGLQWLIRYKERYPERSVGNDWMKHFLELNREAILDDNGRMNFNLRDDIR